MQINSKLNSKPYDYLYKFKRHLCKGLLIKEQHRTSKTCWRNDGKSRENLHSDDQSKQVVSFFFVAVFSKRNRTYVLCVSIHLWKQSWKFGRTRNLKAVEIRLACGSCSHSISPKLRLVFQDFDRNTVHVFYFFITSHGKCARVQYLRTSNRRMCVNTVQSTFPML